MTQFYEAIKTLAKMVGVRVHNLFALAPKNDPFYAASFWQSPSTERGGSDHIN